MRTYTNMTWPDDPYRTGQQLYRRPVPRLAAFTARAARGGRLAPSAVAIVYLPLHRTRTLTVTEQTLTFGFRAATADDPAEAPGLALIADLDLMQARRHAAVLAGHLVAGELAALRQAVGAEVALRGLHAVEQEWAARGPVAGRAAEFDCGLDLPGSPPLELACRQAGITARPEGSPDGVDRDSWQVAALAVERALMIALVCARHQGRYAWTGTLPTGPVVAAATWDFLPWPGTGTTAMPVAPISSDRGVGAASPACGI